MWTYQSFRIGLANIPPVPLTTLEVGSKHVNRSNCNGLPANVTKINDNITTCIIYIAILKIK
jgi:hypothetical protein